MLGTPRLAVNPIPRAFLSALVLSGLVLTAAPKPVEDVSRATLDNGLRVVIVRSPLAPVVTTVVNYLVGSNEAPPGFPGTAHALEHMMFRGSPDLSADQLANIAAAMGGDFNADTQQTVTRYFLPRRSKIWTWLCISNRSGCEICLLPTRFGIMSAARSSRRSQATFPIPRMSFTLSCCPPCSMELLTSTMHSAPGLLDATTGAMLKQFHNNWYAPNNAILVIAGDVDPAATMATVKDLFWRHPR